MKRIILNLGALLMLTQNGFALSDAEYDAKIANGSDKVVKQVWRCFKAVKNHVSTSKAEVCINVVDLLNKNQQHFLYSHDNGRYFSDLLNKVGVLFYHGEKNYLKAYEYWLKAAKLGDTTAQENLDMLCGNHPWVCK